MVVAEKLGAASADSILDAVANVLGINDIKTISLHSTLPELGMDSLTAAEIRQILERDYEVNLSAKDMRTMTLARLKQIQMEKDVKYQSDVSTDVTAFAMEKILRIIGTESETRLLQVKLTSKVDEETLSPKLLLFPGLEGVSKVYEPLAVRLRAHIVCVQYTYYSTNSTIEHIAKSLLPVKLTIENMYKRRYTLTPPEGPDDNLSRDDGQHCAVLKINVNLYTEWSERWMTNHSRQTSNALPRLHALLLGEPTFESCKDELEKTYYSFSENFIEEYITENEPFQFLAYSYGVVVAMEVVNILESKGYAGKIICLDGSPLMMKQISNTFNFQSEENLQTSIIYQVLSILVPNNIISSHKETFFKCKSWEDRLNLLYKITKDYSTLEENYQRTLANSLYERIKALNIYNPSYSKLKSKVKLYKAKEASIRGLPEDHELSQLFENPVEVKIFEGNHSCLKKTQNLRKLTLRRGQIKAQLTKFHNFVTNIQTSDKLFELKARKQKIDLLWSEFQSIQLEIEMLDYETDHSDESESFDYKYFEAMALADAKLFYEQTSGASSMGPS
ncbi:hypothetical protein NQ314_005278 [Rhamnusium bicolor]|uniref:Fatty acid synthase n=1 Tax=Rhamnusium bicolor TaxID=1586634 RepID=A0AAV8ZHG2_9CUCU|nr:hypothetical protein NQ314_005278 [Rhamnusium bicolor]